MAGTPTIPAAIDSDALYAGEIPSILVDRALSLHSINPNSRPTNSAVGEAGDDGEESVEREAELEREGEGDSLLAGNADDDYARSRSSSKAARHNLPWYKRPSPVWFFPGTLMMSLALGMVLPPKIEIYTQLVCRSIPVGRSGTTLPAPLGDFPDLSPTPVLPPRLPRQNDTSILLHFQPTSIYITTLGPVEDDTWAKQCRRSPEVQKAVANLATILTLVMGVLSAITTGYWGSLSDRWGRRPIVAVALAGTVFLDAVFLIVVNYHQVVGYQFLLVGPALDGLLGGQACLTAAVNAYITDCSDSASRAGVFSIISALLFAGIAIGPTLGSVLIQLTGSVMFPFYLALGLHIAYFIILVVALPESLSPSRQADARRHHKADGIALLEKEAAEDTLARDIGGSALLRTRVQRLAIKPFGFLAPLGIFLPRERVLGEEVPILESKSAIVAGKNWNLTKVAASYTAYYVVIAIMQFKILYAAFKFGWGPEENGYYLTFIGFARVIVLLVFLPIVTKCLRRPPKLPTLARSQDPTDVTSTDAWEKEARFLRVVHDSHFDLALAKGSIFIDIFGYILLACNTGGSQPIFLLASGISSCGSAAAPAIQSLAATLTSSRDVGKLFASLAVISSLSGQIFGPIFFGIIFSRTIDSYAEGMFIAGDMLFCISISFLFFVRLEGYAGDEESGELEGEAVRGRSLSRKGSTSPVSSE